MNKFSRLITAVALAATVTACSEQANPVAPAPGTAPASAPAAQPVAAPVVNPVDSLARTMATDKINTRVGEMIDGALTSNGSAGYLLFGPYVSFSAGTYTVAFKGRVDALPAAKKVHLDVVSGKGKVPHGQLDVEQTGELGAFQFTLPDAVGDLEVRVMVPEGSKVTLESYQVSRAL